MEILWAVVEAVDYKVFQPQAKENSVGVQAVEVVLPLVVLVAVLSLVRQEVVAVQGWATMAERVVHGHLML